MGQPPAPVPETLAKPSIGQWRRKTRLNVTDGTKGIKHPPDVWPRHTGTRSRPPCPLAHQRLICGRLTWGSIFAIRCHNKLRDVDWAMCPVFVQLCAVTQGQKLSRIYSSLYVAWCIMIQHIFSNNAHCARSSYQTVVSGTCMQKRHNETNCLIHS